MSTAPATGRRRVSAAPTTRRRRVAALAVGVALLLGQGLTTAQASRLDVRAVGVASRADVRCTDVSVTVTTASNDPTPSVQVAGLPTAGPCAGAAVEVHLAGDAGLLAVATGTLGGPLTAGQDVDPSAVRAALVVVGGYGLPTGWLAPEPPEPPVVDLECRVLSPAGSTCVAEVEHRAWVNDQGEGQAIWTVVARPTGPHGQYLMEVALDTRGYIGWVPQSWENHPNTAISGCPGPVVTLRNLSGWNHTVVARGFERADEPAGVCTP